MPLAPSGPALAAASVPPSAWLAPLAGRSPLVLAPAGARGWFGGRAIVAFDPVASGVISGNGPEALHAAGHVLDRALTAREPRLAAALLPYTGDVRWAIYERGLVLDAAGWRAWGSEPAEGWSGIPSPLPPQPSDPSGPSAHSPVARFSSTSLDERAFCSAVEATREAILDGDVYVLNLTRTVEATTDLTEPELFSALISRAPASMGAAWLPAGAPAIVSASPERFVRSVHSEVTIQPVKGTRPRGLSPELDAHLRDELSGSEKERAEHVMVVDLERNDLGKVCVPGSVRVDPLFEVESTSYCLQAVSFVTGLLRPGATTGDLLEATFPCGSITGAPKRAATRIAAALETAPRGAYTGSLVVAVPGELDSSVLIRTAEVHSGGLIRYGTGCGITVDSDPQAEWEESVLKAQPLLGGSTGPSVALKETCRIAGGRVPLWPYHRARLAVGGCSDSQLAYADRVTAQAAAEWADASTRRARLTLVANPDGTVSVEVAQRLSSLDVVGGLRIARVDLSAAPPLPMPAAKPADRAWWNLAHHTAELAHAHQALLVDSEGFIVDGSTAAVWIAENGVLVTPPAPPAIPSVSVAFVFDRAADAGVPTRVEPISWERFESAEEAFFTNAFGGAAPVRGRSGPLYAAVKAMFDAVWRRVE